MAWSTQCWLASGLKRRGLIGAGLLAAGGPALTGRPALGQTAHPAGHGASTTARGQGMVEPHRVAHGAMITVGDVDDVKGKMVAGATTIVRPGHVATVAYRHQPLMRLASQKMCGGIAIRLQIGTRREREAVSKRFLGSRMHAGVTNQEKTMPQEKPGKHHDHPGHKPGDLDPHGHRDKEGMKEVPGEHHDLPGHKPGDLDPHGHRDKSGSTKK